MDDNVTRNQNCRGLRKALEFDIQVETKALKGSNLTQEGSSSGLLLQLPKDHCRELKAGLKKMATPNGRDVI
ncbi:hypothetical protein SAY86_006137 [Trapa natans]|uniref:Uncharacterized protein n=1 Tax=Trapa natans TaxID=22666 RepID=A0AAN7QT32_TRANT|nr:hypothetical protein SAY86_006137 [Trapa natans]